MELREIFILWQKNLLKSTTAAPKYIHLKLMSSPACVWVSKHFKGPSHGVTDYNPTVTMKILDLSGPLWDRTKHSNSKNNLPSLQKNDI